MTKADEKPESLRRRRRRLALEILIKEAGGVTSLEDLTGTPKSHFSAITAGRRGVGDELQAKLERVLEKPPGWMDRAHELTDVNEPSGKGNLPTFGGSAVAAPSGYAAPKSLQSDTGIPALKSKPDDVEIPLSSAIASMGRGVDQAHEEVVTYMSINRAWLSRNCTYTSLENLSLLTGHGDSMTGIFEDGDVLLVDRGIREIKIDGIYALARNDELFIKRVARRVDGSFLMLSNNPSYPPEPITDAEREKFQVLGRVVMVWNARRM
jgi:phage repressor protein C with HTH and peptisase S24 domain